MIFDYKNQTQCRVDYLCRYITNEEGVGMHAKAMRAETSRDWLLDMARCIKGNFDYGFGDFKGKYNHETGRCEGGFKIDFEGCFRYVKELATVMPKSRLGWKVMKFIISIASKRKQAWVKRLCM